MAWYKDALSGEIKRAVTGHLVQNNNRGFILQIEKTKDQKMNQKNSAQTVHDAIKEKVRRATWDKLIIELDEKELKNVIRAGLASGDVVIQGDIFGIEEQISKEIMLSKRFENIAI